MASGPESLAAAAVRQRLLAALRQSGPAPDPVAAALASLSPELAVQVAGATVRPAAVLVPLLDTTDGLAVLLTRRASDLRDHPGQISFPGGRLEAGDLDPLATALREAAEEIGLDPAIVAIAGYLPPHYVITGFAVTPVVGFVPAGFAARPAAAEVAEVLQVPLQYLLQPGTLVMETRRWQGVEFRSYACEFSGHRIWGATGSMLRTLCDLLYEPG